MLTNPAATAAAADLFCQPRLPTRQGDGPTAPLDARIKKSTEEWVKSRELREHRRLEMESEECTFHPSLGNGGGGGGRRSSSADPRARARLSRPATVTATATPAVAVARPSRRESSGVGQVAAAAFAAREAAFQESKEQRLENLRKEKERQELAEATFQPVIGADSRRASRGGGGGDVSSKNDPVAFKVSPCCCAFRAAPSVTFDVLFLQRRLVLPVSYVCSCRCIYFFCYRWPSSFVAAAMSARAGGGVVIASGVAVSWRCCPLRTLHSVF